MAERFKSKRSPECSYERRLRTGLHNKLSSLEWTAVMLHEYSGLTTIETVLVPCSRRMGALHDIDRLQLVWLP